MRKVFLFLAILALCTPIDAAVKKGRLVRARSAVKKVVQPAAPKAPPSPDAPRSPYRGAIAVDVGTGAVLFAKDADVSGYPASVTKMMTLLLTLEEIDAGRLAPDEKVTASSLAARQAPSSTGTRAGGSMTVDDLCKALMVKSANDAAVMLAERVAGSYEAFVARMNARAAGLGMTATHYETPNGLAPGRDRGGAPAKGFDVSTAADLAKLGCAVVKAGGLRYTSLPRCTVTAGDGKPLELSNHNFFLKGTYDHERKAKPIEGCDGLKTGYTASSGSSIVLTGERNRRRVVVVILGSASRGDREAAAGALLEEALGAAAW